MSGLVRPMRESDVPEAEKIRREAFRSFLGIPDRMMGEATLIPPRFRADPAAAWVADAGGVLLGSNVILRWGSVQVLGPITVRPQAWKKHVGKALMEAAMGETLTPSVTLMGLFTFAQSPRHVDFFRHYGFFPRFLTALMAAPVAAPVEPTAATRVLAAVDEVEGALAGCARLTDAVFPGLDVAVELRATAAQRIGAVVVTGEGAIPDGLAVVRWGPDSEAEAKDALIKFAAVAPGAGAAERFERLLTACHGVAARAGMQRLACGVNLAREEAHRLLLARGFRAFQQGVALHRPADPGYSRPGSFVLDDWR